MAKGKRHRLEREGWAEVLLSAGVWFKIPTELHCEPIPRGSKRSADRISELHEILKCLNTSAVLA